PANEEEWDYSVVKSIFTRHITKKYKKQFQKLVKRKDNSVQKRLEFIVFGLPLSNGNTALFAYAMSGTGFDYLHPLVQKPKKVKLIPDRKSTRLNSSHVSISYAVFCLN